MSDPQEQLLCTLLEERQQLRAEIRAYLVVKGVRQREIRDALESLLAIHPNWLEIDDDIVILSPDAGEKAETEYGASIK